MANVRLEVEGNRASLTLPDQISVVRIFLRSKRVELVVEAKDIKTTVSDSSGVPVIKTKKRR